MKRLENPMETFITGIVLLVVGIVMGIYVGIDAQNTVSEKQAIKHQCAQYNPETGEFEWLLKEGNR